MEGILPLIIFFVVLNLVSRAAQKAKRQQAERQLELPSAGAPPRGGGGLMGELAKALEELKRAEAEARRRAEGGPGDEPEPMDREEAQQAKAREYLAEQKRRAQQRRAAKPKQVVHLPGSSPRRSRAAPLSDDDDKSSEDPSVVSLEGRDYDQEAAGVAEARIRGLSRRVRVEESAEGLSEAQAARRAGRVDVEIGGRAEHAEWHDKLAAQRGDRGTGGPAARGRRAGVLARYADGTARGAVVLSEILARPRGGG